MSVPIGVVGRVPESVHSNHFVRVEDDRERTGGYFIYHWWDGSDGPNRDHAFDHWVLADHLDDYFEEMALEEGQVEWPSRD